LAVVILLTRSGDYTMRLNQAGGAAELHVHPGAPHRVTLFPETLVAQRDAEGSEDWISRHLRPDWPAPTGRRAPAPC
jgi:hypothetical protein